MSHVFHRHCKTRLPVAVAGKFYLDAALRDAFGEHPHVGDIRGHGLFRGVELVADCVHKTPFDSKLAIHKRVKVAAFEAGLICYPVGGTIDGVRGDHILLAPPFIIEEAQIAELVDKLDVVLRVAIQPC